VKGGSFATATGDLDVKYGNRLRAIDTSQYRNDKFTLSENIDPHKNDYFLLLLLLLTFLYNICTCALAVNKYRFALGERERNERLSARGQCLGKVNFFLAPVMVVVNFFQSESRTRAGRQKHAAR